MRVNTMSTPHISAPATPDSLAAPRKDVTVRLPFVAPRATVRRNTVAGGALPDEHQANSGTNSNLH
jgi:hypothetical protein